jgi:hypothetical protein
MVMIGQVERIVAAPCAPWQVGVHGSTGWRVVIPGL